MKNTFITICLLTLFVVSCKKTDYKCECKKETVLKDVNGKDSIAYPETTARIFKDVTKRKLKSVKRQCDYINPETTDKYKDCVLK